MMNAKISKLAKAGLAVMLLALAVWAPVKAAEGIDLNRAKLADVRSAAKDVEVPAITAPSVAAARQPAVARAADMKDWTVMVYMNAKNNLGKYADLNVTEMEEVGSTANMNVVVEIGHLHQGSQRMFIQKKTGDTSNSIVLSTDTAADMGDYKHAIDFAQWAKASYPAKHYMFILWNHGGGWLDPVPQAFFGTKAISIDEDAKDYIRTPQLGEILRQIGPVEVFGMNACLMQMAEVAYEVKDYAGVIIGSEETLLVRGFDYNALLSYITGNPDAAPASIGKVVVDGWQNFMESSSQLSALPGTMSTLNPQALNALPAKLDAFSGAVMNANDTDAVNYALKNVIRFTSLAGESDVNKDMSTYGDLYDFASLVASQSKDAGVQAAASDLMSYITGTLVLSNIGVHTDKQGQDYSKCRGIAINLTMKRKPVPAQFTQILETKYSDLALGKASHWADFVAWTDKVWASAK